MGPADDHKDPLIDEIPFESSKDQSGEVENHTLAGSVAVDDHQALEIESRYEEEHVEMLEDGGIEGKVL